MLRRPRGGWRQITLAAMLLAAALMLRPAFGLAAGSGTGPVLIFPRLDIQVLPEYDTDYPQALVIVQGSLKNTGKDPYTGEVRFWIPKGAQMNSACELSSDPLTTANPVHDNQLARGRTKIEDQGDHQEISWIPTKPILPGDLFPLHMEFYYPAVQGGPDKKVDFTYVPNYAADKVTLAVVQPARSSGYSSSLRETGGAEGGDGTYSHAYELPAVKVGEPIKLQFGYNKPDNNKSVSPQGQAPKPAASGLALKGNQAVLLVAGAMVLGLGFFLFYGGTGSRPSPKRPAGPPGRERQGRTGKGAARGADLEEERRKARKLLLEGKISEDTYREIMRDLKGKER
ncbi:MAG: hypothetical protein M1602_05190 [Firmicutes bacterium]|nr:hypothetical protein [Bacillota bacterium]